MELTFKYVLMCRSEIKLLSRQSTVNRTESAGKVRDFLQGKNSKRFNVN